MGRGSEMKCGPRNLHFDEMQCRVSTRDGQKYVDRFHVWRFSPSLVLMVVLFMWHHTYSRFIHATHLKMYFTVKPEEMMLGEDLKTLKDTKDTLMVGWTGLNRDLVSAWVGPDHQHHVGPHWCWMLLSWREIYRVHILLAMYLISLSSPGQVSQ